MFDWCRGITSSKMTQLKLGNIWWCSLKDIPQFLNLMSPSLHLRSLCWSICPSKSTVPCCSQFSNSIAEGKLFNSWNIHPSIFLNWNRDHGLFKDYSIRLPVLTGQSFPVSLFSFVFLPYLPHEQQFLTQFEPRVHHGLLWMLRFQLLLWITSLLAIQNTAGKTKMLNSVVGQARIIYEDIIFLLFSEKVFTCIFYSVLFGHKILQCNIHNL